MNILHIYDETDNLVARHVAMLQSVYDMTPSDALPDIIHVHGCWQHKIVRQAMQAHRQGARIVFTPHGGLEPWIISKRRLSEKLCKTLLWQRRLTESSYAIIAHGKMEAEALRKLSWNPRIEIIRNAVVTNSITPEAMQKHTCDVYRKIMDSNTLELMSNEACHLMTLLLKAGITGDKRWVNKPIQADIDETEWRRLLIYAGHEHVRTYIDKGAHVLGIHPPYIETIKIESYLPTDYHLPKVESHDVASIVSEIRHGQITLRHLVELDKALRRDDIQDNWLCDTLDENRLLKYLRRLLQVLIETTGIDEGFLPADPIDDHKTQAIRNKLKKNLRI